MLIMTAAKMVSIGLVMSSLGGACIGTGLIFGGFLIGAARNPEEAENLFNSTLMAFALIETFVFMGLLLCGAIYFL